MGTIRALADVFVSEVEYSCSYILNSPIANLQITHRR
jgi:hypothetical protein